MSVSFSQSNSPLTANTGLPLWTPPVRPAQITFGANADAVNLAKTVRFGSEFAGHISEWAKKVSDPPMTQSSLTEAMDKKQKETEAEYQRLKTTVSPEAADKYRKQAGSRLMLDMVGMNLKLAYFQWRYSDSLVPAQVKNRVNTYKWLSFGGWRDWLTDNNHYQRMLVTLRGPIYIKEKQAWVQAQQAGPKQMYELALKQFADPQKMFADTGLNEMPWAKRTAAKAMFYIMRPLARFFINRQLKTIQALQPLQNKVPELPKSFFKAELALLEKEYNSRNASDPIVSIDDKALASGSIGQVYKAKTRSGVFKAIKVARPDATQAFFEAYQPYAYYNELFRTGTSVNQKARACVEVENNTRFLTGESNLGREKTNADMLKDELHRLGINSNLEILAPDFASSTGRSLVSAFVPGKDLTDMKTEEVDGIKEQTVPKVLDALLFSKTCKPLDIHNGNFRKKQDKDVLAWLDFGRQANLNAGVFQHLNDLSVAVMALPGYDGEHGLSSKLVSKTLVDLFSATPASPWAKAAQAIHASNEAIDKLETELNGPVDPNTGERPIIMLGFRRHADHATLEPQLRALKAARETGELKGQIDQLGGLVASLFAPASQLLAIEQRKNLADTGRAGGAGAGAGSKHYYSSSLLSVWANYELMSKKLQNGVADLPALCVNAVSKNDLSNYYEKTRQFMRPYFKLNDNHRAAFQAKVANMPLAEFADLTTDEYGYTSWEINDISKPLAEQLRLAKSKRDSDPAPDESVYKRELATILAKKGDKTVTALLDLLYKRQHENRLADGLTQRYARETEPSLGVTLAPYQLKELTKNVKRGLSEDMSSFGLAI